MKLISLNIWGGLAGHEQLLAFFREHTDVDIFCLQEIWSAPHIISPDHLIGGKKFGDLNIMAQSMQEISKVLKGHNSFFRPHYGDNYGLMILTRKDLQVIAEGELFVHKEKGYIPRGDLGSHARNIQFVTLDTKKGHRTVINFHGLWNGGGKDDSDDRIAQSDKIVQFIKTLSSPFVLCGDFNLLPETESMKKLENVGLKNLIKEHGITSTRTRFYTKPLKFADYALVSEGVEVQKFQVLPNEVSDHSPLYLEFE